MMNRLLFPPLVLLGALLPIPQTSVSPTEYPIVWWHDHQTIEVSNGDKVIVKLECWPESSGYRWAETVSDQSILVPLSPPKFEVVAENEETGEPGGATVQVFRYVVRKAGKAKWSGVYRKGPGTNAVDVFEVDVEVWERRR